MSETSEPTCKKQKVDNNDHSNGASASNSKFTSFEDFELVRVLNNNQENMAIAVEGKLKGRDEIAVVHLQKFPFKKEELEDIFSNKTNLDLVFNNDIYYNQTATLPAELNSAKVTTIYPANEKHIKKFERQQVVTVEETVDIYKDVTVPFINTSSYSKQWIYNILEHKTEVDRIVCEDMDAETGFVLLPDLKWNGESKENLYLMAVTVRRDVSSIRDLTPEHLPLLENIFNKCTKAIKDKYDIPSEDLRIYFHYQPSFYHLHVHFTALTFDAPGTKIGKAYLLSTVMNNLKLCPDYYQKSTLSYTLQKNHLLYKNIQDYYYTEGESTEKVN